MSVGTMRAWTHYQKGLPEEVLTLSTVRIPSLASPTQIRVKISHCALNPGASIVMQLLPFFFRASTAIPEMDFAGVIEAVGPGVPNNRTLEVGTPVFGSIPVAQHIRTVAGALAEYVVVEHYAVVKSPRGIELAQVAGLPIAGATALELVKAAQLKHGDMVLVNGASGGIGHLALQMCRAQIGETGRIVAVCSGSNMAWATQLGADEVIDYTLHEPVDKYLTETYHASRFDAVIDAAGIQSLFVNCPKFLKVGKPYVTVGPRPGSYTTMGMLSTIWLMVQNLLWPRFVGGVPRAYRQVTGIANLEAMQELASRVVEGALTVHVGTRVEMENTKEAYNQLLNGRVSGKIIVDVETG